VNAFTLLLCDKQSQQTYSKAIQGKF